MRSLLAIAIALAAFAAATPADAVRHGTFVGTLPIGKQVTVKCFNDGGLAYEKTGWFLVALETEPDSIILSENPKDPENARAAVISLSAAWACVIETL